MAKTKKVKLTDKQKLNEIKKLLKQELYQLDDRLDENSANYDSEYNSLDGNGVNSSEANLAIRPIANRIMEIIK